uniref:alpha-ketoglutarate-dependent dioxygenase AlkB-like n=1 Tax=Erigeron canadensis TaxID=72917 RepID=UPI001CB8BF7D|nr:alpha-ketoglutarate-dependent dioxygenase AlkB-like [Erigeron canadensis]
MMNHLCGIGQSSSSLIGLICKKHTLNLFQFSSHRGIMNLCKVSHHPIRHLKDAFLRSSVSDHDSDMYKRASLSLYESLVAFGKGWATYSTGTAKQYHQIGGAANFRQTEPFSLILPRNIGNKSTKKKNDAESTYKILGSGMILLKNYLSISDQVEIVNICQEVGIGPGGFYQPVFLSGAKMKLQMMCLGRNWDPQTSSYTRYRSDGVQAPSLPDTLVSLVETSLQESCALTKSKDEIPLMSPDVCIVNFYTTTGRLGLHQDKDESPDSLRRGLPVVSISIGDSAEFLYGDTRDTQKAKKVLLKSGDILIFGGKCRHIFHGVQSIIPYSAPLSLLQKTMLRPGRLNLTLRKY